MKFFEGITDHRRARRGLGGAIESHHITWLASTRH
jgi:hypothetical protein